MNRLKAYIPNFLLSVLLVFSIAGIGIAGLVSNSLLSPEYHSASAQKHGIYERVFAYAEDYFEKSYAVSGIPAEVYMDGLGEDVIKQAVDGKITAFLDYVNGKTDKIAETKVDFTQLEKNLSDFFDKFAEENNVEVNDEFRAQLDNTIKTAKKEIGTFTNIYMLDYMEKAGVAAKLRNYAPILPTVMYALIGVAVLCVVLIGVLNRKKIISALYWISSAGICSAVLMLVPCIIISSKDYFSRLILRTDYVYHAVTGMLNDAVESLMNMQYIILAVSVVLMIAFATGSVILNKKNKDA